MKSFAGRIAVVTGGGSGMGRELVRQLAAEGASVAMCDVSRQSMEETRALCAADGLQPGVRISCHVVDVSDEDQVARFRDEVATKGMLATWPRPISSTPANSTGWPSRTGS